MNGESIQHLTAMLIYMLAVVAIGIYFAKRANKNAESYFLLLVKNNRISIFNIG